MRFTPYVKEQIRLHPLLLPQDALKLCYQAAFGAEHLLQDIKAAQNDFDAEFLSARKNESALYEQLSPDFCRVNLAAWKERGLPPQWLFALFRLSASQGAAPDSRERLLQYLMEVKALAHAGDTAFSPAQWRDAVDSYIADGMPPVRHSAAYRERERPAYRVVSMRLARLIPLLERMSEIPEHGGANVIAIDGRSASGKTTLALQLGEICGAGLVHMDDFFLPAQLRSEARLAQPGGNVHYERFAREVLPNIARRAAFSYQTFDCGRMQLGECRPVAESRWRIVEGAYSCHPKLGAYMDLRVFCDISPEQQLQRIRRRNGEALAAVFTSRWIPMEERYLKAYQIMEDADLLIKSSPPDAR